MLELPGQSALSNFRLSKLTRKLRQADRRVTGVEARFVYLIDTNATPSDEERQRLDALLLSNDEPGTLSSQARTVYVLPRPGTISPWSSKATDIAKACDIGTVERIERGICYGLLCSAEVNDRDFTALGQLLCDRMTEALFTEVA